MVEGVRGVVRVDDRGDVRDEQQEEQHWDIEMIWVVERSPWLRLLCSDNS